MNAAGVSLYLAADGSTLVDDQGGPAYDTEGCRAAVSVCKSRGVFGPQGHLMVVSESEDYNALHWFLRSEVYM